MAITILIVQSELLKADSMVKILSEMNIPQHKRKIEMLCFYEKGYIEELRGSYTKALENYFAAAKLAEEEKNYGFMASTNNGIGLIYFSQNDFDKALSYYLKAVDVHKKNGLKKGLAGYYNNIGNVYYRRRDYAKAMEYYTLALEIRKKLNHELGIAGSLNNIGSVHLELKEYDKALPCFEEAMAIQIRNGDKVNTAYSLFNIASAYKNKKNYNLAISKANEALKIVEEIQIPEALKDSYSVLLEIYEAKGDPANALKYYKLYIKFRDSLANESQLREINRKEMDNEFFKKELLLKAESEKQSLAYAEKEKRDKLILYSTLIVLTIIIIFSVVLFKRFKISQEQKKIIEEKNKEVLDSITYAKRLQGAILIPEAELRKYFSDAFILFRPKDIVSGDFYWFSESENNKILALADCTGHGVPGGFMSMLGYESLQDVALRESITTTSDALKSLDKKITETLNKSDRSFRDGMDIALCAFSKTAHTVQFSGANRPLLYISDGVLTEFDPDKNTIGGDIDNLEKVYTTKNISIKKGDVFYMTTDGYGDQFGGPKGKKFKFKNLQNILLSISSLPMDQQKEHLERTFLEWKGDLEQIDDVSIIGLKI